MMAFKPIRTAKDSEKALARIGALMDAEWGISEGLELDILVDRVARCGSEHEPMMRYPSVEAGMGVTAKELAEWYPWSSIWRRLKAGP